MPTDQPDKMFSDEKKHQGEPVSSVLGQHVMRILGRPPGEHQVRVRQLWKDHYRVNIFVGQPASAKVMHSYFMVVDGEGNVVTAEPPIVNRY